MTHVENSDGIFKEFLSTVNHASMLLTTVIGNSVRLKTDGVESVVES